MEDIAAGTGRSIARRILAMGRSAQISYAEPIVFSGGVANNEAIADIFADLLGKPVTAIKMPQSKMCIRDRGRLHGCCVHIINSRCEVIPFCAFHLTSVDGQRLYMN